MATKNSLRNSRKNIPSVLRKFCTLSLSMLEDRSTPSISGLVFQDYNANGVLDLAGSQANTGQGSSNTAVDRGLAGITVTAFDASNNVAATATTNSSGAYTLTTSASGPYRVEFTNLPAGVSFGPQGPANGSSVQFVDGPNAINVNLSLVRPEDYSPNNPLIVTSQYFVGGTTPQDLNPGASSIISFPYNAGSVDSDPNRANHQIGDHALQVAQMQVGATWGLGYNSQSNQVYAAAYMKRTTGFGPGGPGAIYVTGATGNSGALLADLNAIFPGDFPAGNLNSLYTDVNGDPVPFRNNVTGTYNWFLDGLQRVEVAPGVFRDVGWDAVGKIGLGGLDVSDDGSRIYVMALGDRRLYSLPTSGPINSSTVFRYDVPLPSTVTGSGLGDLRPFAVEVHRGIVYVGAVNTAESTQNAADLRAYVFAFDPSKGTFVDSQQRTTTSQAIFEFSLNYPRGQVHVGFDADATFPGGFTPPDPAEWNAWSPEHRVVQTSTASLGRSSYPQPMFTGISFDTDGNLAIGLRDRSGDQIGRNVPIDPAQPNNYSPFSITAGDTLRAFINAPRSLDVPGANFAGWTLESNSRGPNGQGTGPLNNGQGPGNGEFYFDDDFPRDPSTTPIGVATENDEVSMGSVIQLPGFGQTIASSFDPVRQVGAINGGGFRWYDSVSGAVSRTYELYVSPTNNNTSTFAKGNGLGDLIAVTGAAPIEIGNFVWNDTNRNGIQDAGESGLANVSLDLYSGGTKIATAITDSNGNYIFSSGAGTSTASRIFGLALASKSNYEIRVGAVAGKAFTVATNDASSNGTSRDSNASSTGIVNVTTGVTGSADHTFDIGVVAAPRLSIGDTVWIDTNNDGRKQSTEVGVDGVIVNLFAANGTTLVSSMTTGNGGRYLFTNLSAGSYVVEIVPPNGFVSSTGKIGSAFGAFEPGVSTNENDADHGSNAPGGVIRSSLVVLGASGDTLNPDSDNGVANSANLRVDFGLIRPLSVGNLVFNDVNNDGIRQDTEAGIGGVTINLRNVAGDLVASTVTNSAGGYLFTNLIAGKYVAEVVRSTLPGSEYASSTGANSASGPFEPANGRSVDSTDYGTTFGDVVRGPVIDLNYSTQPLGEAATAGGVIDNAADADSNLLQDFGFFRTLSLGNLVWNDVNNDGKRQDSEAGLGGVAVRLLDSNGAVLGTTFTIDNGTYLFTGLFPGSYSVAIDPPNGFTSSTGNGLRQRFRTGPYEPAALVNPNDNEDKGTVVGLEIRSNPVTLFVAGSPNNPQLNGLGNTTVDFGLVLRKGLDSVPASVSGYVYRDIWNTNGQRETAQGETGIVGVRVVLTGVDVDGITITPLTAFTDSKGFYEFTNLTPGKYVITESQPRGFYDGIDTVGNLGGAIPNNDVLSVTLNDNDAGVEYNFGEVLGAAVFGYVYEDLNQNRRFDAGEPGIANVTITISGTAFAGTPMAHPLNAFESLNGLVTRTDANGRWEFPLLPAGSYTIVETQPVEYLDFFESVQEPLLRPVSVGNDVFNSVVLTYNETRGPLNYGEIRRTNDNTKRNFLGSSGGSGTTPTITPPVSVDPGSVTTTPAFSVNTGTPGVPSFVVLAAAAGRSPLVRVLDYSTGVERFRFFAYEENYTGGVRVATGDVDGDGTPDIIAATGQGGGPRIRVFSGLDGSIIKDFFAFEPEFRGGVFVAAADVNNDGKADILAGTELGGGPRLTVFDVANNTRLHDFFAFDSNQRGGLRVAAADFNGDGFADLVATAGRGNQTRVKVFDGRDRTLLSDFVPYAPNFTGGVFIAAGDVTGDGKADVITSADVGGGPHVQVFDNLTGRSLNSFFAEDSNYRGGIRLATQDVDGDGVEEIITGTGPGAPAHVRIWKNGAATSLEDFYAFDAAYTGGVYVG